MNRLTAAGLVAASLLVSACLLPNFGNFGPFGDEQFPLPTTLATYTSGSAQVDLTQAGESQSISLDSVGRGSALNNLSGAAVSWRSDDGWVLQVNAYDPSFFLEPIPSGPEPTQEASEEGYVGDVSLQRIADHEFWTVSSYTELGNRCIVDITEASGILVTGTATCRGLRWTDGTAPMLGETVYVEGQEPFDAEITFEARP